MDDIRRRKLEEGHKILYFFSFSGSIREEEATIIKIREKSIKIEFLGGGHYPFCREKGEKTNVYNTSGKVFILEEASDLKEKIKDLTKEKNYLIKENKRLQEQVNKIHNRFDILDL